MKCEGGEIVCFGLLFIKNMPQYGLFDCFRQYFQLLVVTNT